MSAEVLNALSVFFALLLLGSIVLSAYLIYDIKSGNYRKFLSSERKHTDLADKVPEIRTKNLGEEA